MRVPSEKLVAAFNRLMAQRCSSRAAIPSRRGQGARLSEAIMSQFRPAKRRTSVSVGESVRIIRELQELSQNQLAELTGIPASNNFSNRERPRQSWRGASQGSCSCSQVPSRGAGLSRLGCRAICGITNCSSRRARTHAAQQWRYVPNYLKIVSSDRFDAVQRRCA